MTLVDTNIILRLIDLHDIKLTTAAADLLARQPEDSVLISDAVLAECFYVLVGSQFGFTRAHASQVLINIIQQPVFTDTTPLLEASKLFVDTKLDFVDCLLLARVRQSRGSLLTQDKQLAKLAEANEN